MTNKKRIIQLFRENVRGRKPDLTGRNLRHDGGNGQWLEAQFGVSANADNHADILGYELKNETTSKTTFGDWSANEYIFKTGKYVGCFSGGTSSARQDSFCRIFGKPNEAKAGRYSWSGSPIPKIGCYNIFGQIMIIDEFKNIVIYYSYSQDKRPNKHYIVPQELQHDEIQLARWYGESWPIAVKKTCRDKTLKEKLEDKFNDAGWFTCKTGPDGTYQKICFGNPMTFDYWLSLVLNGTVFFDSGMYVGNKRPYSQWRASNSFWDSLIVDCYD